MSVAVPEKRGFFYGWVVVGVASAGLFVNTTTAPPMVSIFLYPMTQELGWSRSLYSGALTVGTILNAITAPFIGRLVDRYGARVIFTISGTILGSAMWGLSMLTNALGFYLSFALARLFSQGVLNLGGNTAVANWFVQKRGLATAVANLGRALGATVLPLLAQVMIQTQGWRAAWQALGVIIWAVLVLPAALFMRRRPEDMGLRPDGAAAPGSFSQRMEPQQRGRVQDVSWSLTEALHTPVLWLLVLIMVLMSPTIAGVSTHTMPLLLDRGAAPMVAALAVSLSSVFMGLGGLMWGFLVQRMAIRHCMACIMAAFTVSTLMLAVLEPVPLLFLATAIFGSCLGGIFTLEPVIWADYFGRSSLGTIRGFALPFQWTGMALGPLLAGMSSDLTGSYWPAFLGFALACSLGGLLLLAARPPSKSIPS
ncbi:MAG: MFS transporter [Chloroflexota bacterium]|nr:MFS transporter [Chloroflexota bacterium]